MNYFLQIMATLPLIFILWVIAIGFAVWVYQYFTDKDL